MPLFPPELAEPLSVDCDLDGDELPGITAAAEQVMCALGIDVIELMDLSETGHGPPTLRIPLAARGTPDGVLYPSGPPSFVQARAQRHLAHPTSLPAEAPRRGTGGAPRFALDCLWFGEHQEVCLLLVRTGPAMTCTLVLALEDLLTVPATGHA